MRTASYVSIMTIINMLLASVMGSMTAAGSEKTPKSRESQNSKLANSQTTSDGRAKWLADPDLGWVRTDGHHKVNDRGNSAARHDRGKNKKTAKKKKGY